MAPLQKTSLGGMKPWFVAMPLARLPLSCQGLQTRAAAPSKVALGGRPGERIEELDHLETPEPH